MGEFEWDQAKAAANLEKHAIDFEDAINIFEGAVIEGRSDRGTEQRWKAIGILDDVVIAVIYTRRETARRIISARKAKRMKEERIVRRTLESRKKGKTDWARLRPMTEEEVDRNAESDPDNPPWTEEELAAAQLVLPSTEPRVAVSIRLHPEVVRFFKKQGAGYQSRINAVLLGYVRSQKKNVKKNSSRRAG